MASNLERYKKDLEILIYNGRRLLWAMNKDCYPDEFLRYAKKAGLEEKEIEKLPNFFMTYQIWYSEALTVIKQLIPDRKDDFIRLYEKPKNRKSINHENYTVEDYLNRLKTTREGNAFLPKKTIVSPESAITNFEQQIAILKSSQKRFESSLFDIKQLLQADLFDSELSAAEELNKKGFVRGSGIIAGVVLEKHLLQVCENHKIRVTKRNPAISDLNELLKNKDVIDIPTWRNVQYLADLRNRCSHKKEIEAKKKILVI